MKKCSLVPFMLLGLAAFLIAGCSSSTKSEGSLSDTEFQIMDQILNESMMSFNIEALKLSLNLIDSVSDITAEKPLFTLHKANDEILQITELSYSYYNSWHIYSVTAKIISDEYGETDSLLVTGIDSLRFLIDGEPRHFPDPDSTDEVNIRMHFDMDAFSALGGTFSFNHHTSFDITGEDFELDVFTLNGETSDSVDISFDDYDGVSCDIFLNADQNFTDIFFNTDLECPDSGISNITAIVDMACSDSTQSFDVNGTWTGDFTFEGEDISVIIESGNTRWSFTDTCGTGGDPYSVKR